MESRGSIKFHQMSDSMYKVYFQNGVELGDLVCKEDGYFSFWPYLRAGCWDAYVLRDISNLLDEINAPWEKIVNTQLALL